MITEEYEVLRGWLNGRLPQGWEITDLDTTVDREEITVLLHLADLTPVDGTSDAEAEAARVGRAKAFREETRDARMAIAREVEDRWDRKVSWGVVVGEHQELFTHIAVPVMTRLKQPQRQVLDTLIEAGVARSRSEALAWCVRLVEQHEDDWLTELREAMTHVAGVRARGPAA